MQAMQQPTQRTSEGTGCLARVETLPLKVQWPFVPRKMTADDNDLVYGGWLDSLRGNTPYNQIRHGIYKPAQSAIISRLIKKPGVEVLIAAHPDGEPKFGFVCYEWAGDDFVLHYIYTRSTYRQHNIASALLQFAGCSVGKREVTASHWTKDMKHYREKWNLSYNPYVAWGVCNEGR